MSLPMWTFWAALAAMIVGLLGVVLPIVPGVGFVWLVLLVYAIAERFTVIDPLIFAVLSFLGAIGVSADLWMGQVGAKIGGASVWSLLVGMVLGAIGAVVGAIFLGIGALLGALIGALAGVILTEWYWRRDWREAFKAGGGWLIGCTLSGGVQLLIAILMILIFVWQVLKAGI